MEREDNEKNSQRTCKKQPAAAEGVRRGCAGRGGEVRVPPEPSAAALEPGPGLPAKSSEATMAAESPLGGGQSSGTRWGSLRLSFGIGGESWLPLSPRPGITREAMGDVLQGPWSYVPRPAPPPPPPASPPAPTPSRLLHPSPGSQRTDQHLNSPGGLSGGQRPEVLLVQGPGRVPESSRDAGQADSGLTDKPARAQGAETGDRAPLPA